MTPTLQLFVNLLERWTPCQHFWNVECSVKCCDCYSVWHVLFCEMLSVCVLRNVVTVILCEMLFYLNVMFYEMLFSGNVKFLWGVVFCEILWGFLNVMFYEMLFSGNVKFLWGVVFCEILLCFVKCCVLWNVVLRNVFCFFVVFCEMLCFVICCVLWSVTFLWNVAFWEMLCYELLSLCEMLCFVQCRVLRNVVCIILWIVKGVL